MSIVQSKSGQLKKWELPPDLKGLSQGDLFAIIATLGKLLEYERKGGVQRPVITRAEQYNLSPSALVEASSAVLGWPDKFFELAEKVRFAKPHIADKVSHPLMLGIPANLGPLGSFVQREIKRRQPAVIQRHYFRNARHELIEVGYAFPRSVQAQIAQLGHPVSEMLTLYRTGSILCPDPILRRRLGTPENAPLSNLDRLKFSPKAAEIGMLVTEIVRGPKPSRQPWAAVCGSILSGQIDAVVHADLVHTFTRSLYTRQELEVKTLCLGEPLLNDGRTEIGLTKDALFYLGMGYGTFALLRQEGMLPEKKLRLADVWEFQDSFMTTSEMRSRLKLSKRTAEHKTVWKAVDKFGFRRVATGIGVLDRRSGEEFLKLYISDPKTMVRNQKNFRDPAITEG